MQIEEEKDKTNNKIKISLPPLTPLINRNELTKNLFQYLFYPRILLGKEDALYVQKIIYLLILSPGNNINTLDIMIKIPKFLQKAIICVTESEAENIGLFLNAFLNMIQNYQEEKFWEEKCKKNPSFSRKLEEIVMVELKDFKNAFNDVLKNLTNSIEEMFKKEKELSNIRNIITMINRIPLIPPNKEAANSFYKVLLDIHEKNPNFILLESYINVLVNNFKLEIKIKANGKTKENDNNEKEDNYQSNNSMKRDKSQLSKRSLGKNLDKDRRRREQIRTRDRDMERSKERRRERSRDKDKEYKRDEKNNDNKRYKSERGKRK